MHSSITIANCFLDFAERDSESLTPMKIQKLVYIAHGWHLGLNGEPLVSEEAEAWDFGPVFPLLYREFKQYGGGAIVHKGYERGGFFSTRMTGKVRKFLGSVWDVYRKYTGIQLANLTHEPNSPWDTTTTPYGSRVPQHLVIENQTIQEYYKKLANKDG